jgi:hypothetical protein
MRGKRRIFIGSLLRSAVVVSALLFIVVIVEWTRSYRVAESVEYFWNVRPHSVYQPVLGATTLRLEHSRGRTKLWYVGQVCLPQDLRPNQFGESKHWRYNSYSNGLSPAAIITTPPDGAVLGLNWRTYHRSDTVVRVFWLPDYFFALFLSILPVCSFLNWVRRRRRRRSGRCIQCGYDLRSGHERCPECGGACTTLARQVR